MFCFQLWKLLLCPNTIWSHLQGYAEKLGWPFDVTLFSMPPPCVSMGTWCNGIHSRCLPGSQRAHSFCRRNSDQSVLCSLSPGVCPTHSEVLSICLLHPLLGHCLVSLLCVSPSAFYLGALLFLSVSSILHLWVSEFFFCFFFSWGISKCFSLVLLWLKSCSRFH